MIIEKLFPTATKPLSLKLTFLRKKGKDEEAAITADYLHKLLIFAELVSYFSSSPHGT
jgi:hypothetical protein